MKYSQIFSIQGTAQDRCGAGCISFRKLRNGQGAQSFGNKEIGMPVKIYSMVLNKCETK